MANKSSIVEFAHGHPEIKTPYYLIDETRLLKNLERIAYVRDKSGAKALLALKCFSTWAVFPLMRKYMDGTTSSSLNEARLGHEKFGKETHAYSVAWSKEDISNVKTFASKIIFNSFSQLRDLSQLAEGVDLGLRVNPGISYSHFALADPAREASRLGVRDRKDIEKALLNIHGVMIHNQCDNDDFQAFSRILDQIGEEYGSLLKKLEWVTLGGGISFTKDGYPLHEFAKKLKDFSTNYDIQVYLEPGEAAVTGAGYLITSVLDIVHDGADIAIVDAASNSHMPDLLTYRIPAQIEMSGEGNYKYRIAGRTCLAGDSFGTFSFAQQLKIGSIVPIPDAAGYSIVQKNWFNGVSMPSIVIHRLDKTVEVARIFKYDEFVNSMS